MSRKDIAQALGAASTWMLRNIFHRPAENFPGKVGLFADPNLIGHLASRITEGSIVIVGTNGKTTVTNLLADALEISGKAVACNRSGANLDSGIASALLHTESAEWGVFESDELWLSKTLPQLQPDFAVLLNLFRDQLDRAGEIDHVQQRIADALSLSPSTTLIYNADDPFCQAIADRCDNATIPFGICEDLGLPQNHVTDSRLCQTCDTTLDYLWLQYGQLGSYHCPNCGFARSTPIYQATDIKLDTRKISLTVHHGKDRWRIESPLTGAYMAYNLLAICAAADCCKVPFGSTERAIRDFSPANGRLQTYRVGERTALLNLAKNPVGLNQNIRIVSSAPGPKAIAFFINDKEADGHDVSWLWDVDFEELAKAEDIAVFAGGIRRNDLQVRLKYAGIEACLIDGANDFVQKARTALPKADLFLIANYTALPSVKAALDEMAKGMPGTGRDSQDPRHIAQNERTGAPESRFSETPAFSASTHPKLEIVHLYPDLLNLYGDGGNAAILANRAQRRGIDARIIRVAHGDSIDLRSADIVFLGGGPDREQLLASRDLLIQADALRDYVEDDGVFLAICGGYQMLGREWLLAGERIPGLGILDIATGRAQGGSQNRLVGDIALDCALAKAPVIGYENHAGRTFIGKDCTPFGRIIGKNGHGNNDGGSDDGIRYRNVLGTYLHGPLLAKNPEIADWLLGQALARRAAKEGIAAPPLAPLDDSVEQAANRYMRTRLGIRDKR